MMLGRITQAAVGTPLLAFIAVFAAATGTAVGGGPLVVSTDGVPVGWDTTSSVTYHTDLGNLGVLSNPEAVALAETLFEPWGDVPTATITFASAGTTTVDVDATNFGPFLGPFGGGTAPIGQNVIVFDADGAIFDTLFGVGTGVLGFAGPTFFSDGISTVPSGAPVPPGAEIVEGLAFLNGKWIDGVNDPGSGNNELPLAVFEAVFVHEFGHFAGLDHTQIHGLNHSPDSNLPGKTRPVETMFPFLIDYTQATLERDDAVALSVLYPTVDFAISTGRITGRVLATDGTPFSGVNVIARNLADDADAVSYVSGATIVPAGQFSLAGLTPGASYRVEIQEVDAFHSGGSRVGPFSPAVTVPAPPEFYNGVDESADPITDDPSTWTAVTAAAGATTSGVDILLNSQPFSVRNVHLVEPGGPLEFAIGDFDEDGVVDFIAPQFSSPTNTTRFYRGLGGGAFAPPVTIASFPGNKFAVAGQFNAGEDGFLDIAVASHTLSEVRVYFGDGAGGFGPPMTLVDAPDIFDDFILLNFAMGDLNGDAFPDLVSLVYDHITGGATAYAMLGSASGSFAVVATSLPAESGFPRGDLIIGQFAGNSAGDGIGIASSGSFVDEAAELGLLTGDGAGSFVVGRIPLTSITDRISFGLAVGDLDEDGIDDLILNDLKPVGDPTNWTRSFIDVLLGDGNAGFTLSDRYSVPESFQAAIIVADIDADGHLDIASTDAWFAPGSPGAKLTVAFGDGAGRVGDVTTIWGLAEFPQVIAAADLDGEGNLDLLVSDSVYRAFELQPVATYSVLLHAATATTSTTVTTSTATTSTTTSTLPPGGCPPSPGVACRTGFEKGFLLVKEKTPGKEKMLAKWIKGPALAGIDFGNPLSNGGTAYSVCIYDDDENLAGVYTVDRAGDTCGKPCWRNLGKLPGDPKHKGYRYKDKATTADGILLMLMKGGAVGKSKALAKGKNNAAKGQLILPTGVAAALSGSTEATIQLLGSDAPKCISVTVSDVLKNDGFQFKAKK